MSFLKKHYEKAILTALLLVFVLLLGFQILIILKARDVDIDSVVGVKPPRPDYKKIEPNDPAYELMILLGDAKGVWAPNRNKPEESDLCDAPPLIRCPFGLHMIPVSDFPKQNAKAPGKCSYCGRDIRVLISDLMITEDDSDGDGIPDKWEIQYNLKPNDPNDAKLDPDDDGFTNLEEYQAKTNPNDPKSRPTYAKKLYVVDVVSVPLGMRLKHFGSAGENIAPEKWDIQIELLRKNGRTYKQLFSKIGDVISVNKKNYIIDSIQLDFVTNAATQARENKSRIVLYNYDPKTKKRSGEKIIGFLGNNVVDPRKQVTFLFTVNNEKLTGFVGDSIDVGNERRGIDKYIIQEGNEPAKTARLKAESGMIENIHPLPADYDRQRLESSPDEEDKTVKKRTPQNMGLPDFKTNRKNKI